MTPPPTSSHLLTLSAELGQRLTTEALTIALAESCTGGLLASTLTDAPGSSAYVLGGVVAYSNEVKMRLLGVEETTLQTHGAVSAETAAEMAGGARRLFGSDLALAVTGIAGPGGGAPDKPTGTVYLHLSAAHVERGEHHVWPHDRIGNKQASVAAALQLALRYVAERPAPAPNSPERAERPVVVEAEWRGEQWRPEAVWIEGQRREIVAWGRQSRRADGSTEVMAETADGSRLELVVDVTAGHWRLARAWWARRPV